MPKEKAGPITRKILYAFAICIDLIQVFLDGFAIGIIINRVIDILVGLTLIFIFALLRILDLKAFLSLLLGFVIEQVPFLDIAPAWTLDVMYVLKRARAKYQQELAAWEQNMAQQQAESDQQDELSLYRQQQDIRIKNDSYQQAT